MYKKVQKGAFTCTVCFCEYSVTARLHILSDVTYTQCGDWLRRGCGRMARWPASVSSVGFVRNFRVADETRYWLQATAVNTVEVGPSLTACDRAKSYW